MALGGAWDRKVADWLTNAFSPPNEKNVRVPFLAFFLWRNEGHAASVYIAVDRRERVLACNLVGIWDANNLQGDQSPRFLCCVALNLGVPLAGLSLLQLATAQGG